MFEDLIPVSHSPEGISFEDLIPNKLADVANSGGSGVVKGDKGLLGLGGDAGSLLSSRHFGPTIVKAKPLLKTIVAQTLANRAPIFPQG
jgi:hypothetical protein